jgi:disulfide bond formation protein DsbB
MSDRADPIDAPGLVWLPFSAALVALAGSLWLSLGMGLKACPLCFYQRTFVMAVVAVFAVGLLIAKRYRGVLNVLALPLATAGAGVAAFHVYLELTGKLECPLGILGVGTAPQQSLTAIVIVLALTAVGVARAGGSGRAAPAAGVALGLLLSVASVVSAPPMPQVPAEPYQKPPDVCRPPYPAG